MPNHKWSVKEQSRSWRQRAAIIIPRAGSFPIDMLRYDACHPIRETHSNLVEESLGIIRKDAGVVVVERMVTNSGCVWTLDRWKSFGVTCIPIDPDGVIPDTIDEIANVCFPADLATINRILSKIGDSPSRAG